MLLFYVDDTGVAEEELQPGCRFIKEEGKVVLGDWSPGDRGPNRQTRDLGPAWRFILNLIMRSNTFGDTYFWLSSVSPVFKRFDRHSATIYSYTDFKAI